MNESIIAHRYAAALYEFAKGKNALESVYNDSKLIRSELEKSKSGIKFINSQNIKISEKRLFFSKIFGSYIDGVTLRFLDFILEQQRHTLLNDMLRIFEDIYRREKNIYKVKLTTAVEMNNQHMESFKNGLSKKLNGTVELTVDVDKSIIGGSIIRVGDRQLDSSVKNRLKKIEKHLSE